MALLDGAWLQACYHRLCIRFAVQLEARPSFGNSIVTLDGTLMVLGYMHVITDCAYALQSNYSRVSRWETQL